MNMNFGKFEIIETGVKRWCILRNNELFNASFGTREEAVNHLLAWLHMQVDNLLNGI